MVQNGKIGRLSVGLRKPVGSSRVAAKILSAAVVTTGLLSASSALATSGTWNASPTDGNWVASGAENNWSNGLAAFPGSTSVLTNGDTATFNNASLVTGITINSSSLNIKGLTFDTSASAYTIGATNGNSLLLTSGGAISMAATMTGTGITETINAPLVLEPTNATSTGVYAITNASTTASNVFNIAGSIQGGTTTGTVTLTLGGANTGINTISGSISNGSAASLSITTAGAAGNIWVLSGNNSYSGSTNVGFGILDINSATALGASALVLQNGRAVIDNTSSGDLTLTTNNAITTPGSFTFNGTHSLNLGTGAVNLTTHPTITVLANTLTIGGNISGVGISSNIIKSGAGTLALTGNISYLGNTAVSGGTLLLSGDNSGASGGVLVTTGTLDVNSVTALGTGTLTMSNAAAVIDNTSGSDLTLTTVTPETWTNSFTFTGTNNLNLGIGAVAITTTTPTITTAAGVLTVGGAIGVTPLGVTKAGLGTLVFGGANLFTGATTVNAGILNYQNGTAFGTNSAITSASGATVQVQGGIAGGSLVLKIAGAGATGATGALESVSGTNSYGGTVQMTAASTISSDASSVLTLAGVTGSAFGVTLTGAGNGNVGSAIATTTGTVTKTGAGIWKLSGTNTYTGATSVNNGTLIINGSLASGAAATTVNTGGTLGGTGSVRAITLNEGGAINPGDGGIGTLTSSAGGVTWNGQSSGSTAQMRMELSNADSTSDLLNITGVLTKGTGTVFDFDFGGTGQVGTTYTLIDFTSSSGFVLSNFNAIGTTTGTFTLNPSSLEFTVSAVPEPGSLMMGSGAMAFGFLRRRRREIKASSV